jgi:hypothetical protein
MTQDVNPKSFLNKQTISEYSYVSNTNISITMENQTHIHTTFLAGKSLRNKIFNKY